ncbi:hypothetical protein [Ruegeria denitrificans]|uniref:hypothetical protein n=1 Tax=Ruegeria denitrificans TaxID=1715692 RepID=UPI003C799713
MLDGFLAKIFAICDHSILGCDHKLSDVAKRFEKTAQHKKIIFEKRDLRRLRQHLRPGHARAKRKPALKRAGLKLGLYG